MTCFYLDPPYLPETRRKKQCYHQEMTLADHERLMISLNHLQGMVILSGYDHPLYQEALTSWDCLKQKITCSSVNESTSSTSRERTECIWRNPACRRQQATLFGSLQEYEVCP